MTPLSSALWTDVERHRRWNEAEMPPLCQIRVGLAAKVCVWGDGEVARLVNGGVRMDGAEHVDSAEAEPRNLCS